MANPIIVKLQDRYNELSNRNRIFLFLFGWIVIYGLWYFLYASSDMQKRAEISEKYNKIQDEITIDKTQIVNIIKDAKKQESNTLVITMEKNQPKIYLKDSPDQVIKQFFNLENDIKSISLKSSSITPTSYGLQIQFNSGYFAAMAYLQRLEKLPWCLAWDSLIYRVNVHPDATINLTLHTVGGA